MFNGSEHLVHSFNKHQLSFLVPGTTPGVQLQRQIRHGVLVLTYWLEIRHVRLIITQHGKYCRAMKCCGSNKSRVAN